MEVEVKINDHNDVEASSCENKEAYSKKLKDLSIKVIKKLVIGLVLVLLFFLISGNSLDQYFSTFDGVMTTLAMTVFMYQLATIFLFVYDLSSDKSSGSKGGVVVSLVVTIVVIILLTVIIGPWIFNSFILPMGIDFDSGFGLVLKSVFMIVVFFGFFIIDVGRLIYLSVKVIKCNKKHDFGTSEDNVGEYDIKHFDSIEEAEAEKQRLLTEEKLNSNKES